jgi:hypothetical protein
LVRFVTPEVKFPTSPRILAEKFCTPVTTEAAIAEPGRLTRPPEEPGMEPEEGTEGDDMPAAAGR